MDGVKIIVKALIRKGDKFLVLRRSSDDVSRPNLWDFPGGNLEKDEHILKALKREVKEESSVRIKNLRPLHIISGEYKKNNFFWVMVGYIADYSSGKVKISHEHRDFRWVTKKEFLKLKSANYLREFIKRV